jgi:IS5 family transposase
MDIADVTGDTKATSEGGGKMPARFRTGDQDSFFGEYLYKITVPQDHFLRHLRALVDWDKLTKDLVDLYKGGAEYGGVPYHPSVLFRMLLLAYLYKLTERQVELFVNDSLAARFFLGLAATEPAPDHSSLSVFRSRILEKKGTEAFEAMFQDVVRLAMEKGIKFGRIQVVDATHTVADVDTKKDKERQAGGSGPRDPDAAWGNKGQKKIRTTKGDTVDVSKTFYGYKTHASENGESEIVTSVAVTPGNKWDGHQLRQLLEKDQAVGVKAGVYAGDKGYDDGDNHEMLWSRGISSALCLKEKRTTLYPKGLWADTKASLDYREGLSQRYKIEQKNAEAKRRHGLDRCHYLGLEKYTVQALVTFIAINLKRMVKLLSGISFRQPALQGAGA